MTGLVSHALVYSYNPNQPYYVQSLGGGSFSQRITGPFDATVRFEKRRLPYRDRSGPMVQVSNSIGFINQVGVGAGYRLGRDKRLGFMVDRVTRSSTTSL